jgi:uncharacterized protein (DUF58 family)
MRLFRWGRPPSPSPPPVVRRMRDLEILTARLIRAGFAGQYHAAFHGHGIEFSQVREYQPGDDIRTIDWKVTARTSVPHVKQFVEERDLAVVIAIDVSHSMNFGSIDRRKSDLAVELMAILSFAALQNNDRVGLVLYSDSVREFIPPRRGRKYVQMLVRKAIGTGRRTAGRANLDRLAQFLGHVVVKRSVVILLSDLLDGPFERPLRSINQRHDLVTLIIRDPRESRFPERGIVRLVDAESGERELVDLRRNRVATNASARLSREIGSIDAIRVDAMEISTGIPYDRQLLRFFEERVRRRR